MSMDRLWYGDFKLASSLLRPLSWIYRAVTVLRRWYLERFCQITCPVPLIVIGNISVGGVGKTPLVVELANQLQQKGIEVGIVSRGYGARIKNTPYEVKPHDEAFLVGDEPLLMAQKTQCPVVIAPLRNQAVSYLLAHHNSQVIISDDGLQHYRMGRAIEIAVLDGTRGLGNGLCLPAGPLREPAGRLNQVDFIVVNEGVWHGAYPMSLIPGALTKLATLESINMQSLKEPVVAVAGIGNPQRFYSTLKKLKIEFTPYSFPDHHQFAPAELNYEGSVVIMTEKDAVKCRSFVSDRLYFLPVKAQLSDAFWNALWSHQQLKGYCS